MLQVDGYGGYKVLAHRGEVRLAFCWSHVRRLRDKLALVSQKSKFAEAIRYAEWTSKASATCSGSSTTQRRSPSMKQRRRI